jgi:SAM-dependent methyltransferase
MPGDLASYEQKYRDPNYFNYREWLYGPYVSSLISFCRLSRGSAVLDVGCGQGFFSYQFHKAGMCVQGIDISETGIRMAQAAYGHLEISFQVADIHTARFPIQFDCVFARGCSLFNVDSFPSDDSATRKLLRHVKPGGVYVFASTSRFSGRASPNWRYHSLRDAAEHFRTFRCTEVFFSTRIDTLLLRKYAFNGLVTRLNVLLSSVGGIGGDLICVYRKPSEEVASGHHGLPRTAEQQAPGAAPGHHGLHPPRNP